MLYHIIFITACAQNVFLQHERKRSMLMWLSNSTYTNQAVDAPFQFEMNTITVKYATDFHW